MLKKLSINLIISRSTYSSMQGRPPTNSQQPLETCSVGCNDDNGNGHEAWLQGQHKQGANAKVLLASWIYWRLDTQHLNGAAQRYKVHEGYCRKLINMARYQRLALLQAAALLFLNLVGSGAKGVDEAVVLTQVRYHCFPEGKLRNLVGYLRLRVLNFLCFSDHLWIMGNWNLFDRLHVSQNTYALLFCHRSSIIGRGFFRLSAIYERQRKQQRWRE